MGQRQTSLYGLPDGKTSIGEVTWTRAIPEQRQMCRRSCKMKCVLFWMDKKEEDI